MNLMNLQDNLMYKYYRRYRPEHEAGFMKDALNLSNDMADYFENAWQLEVSGELVFLETGCTVPAYVILEG